MPIGRPSTFPSDPAEVEKLCAQVIECGRLGMSEVEIACEIGVLRTTMRSWAESDRSPDFSSALSRANAESQAWWEKKARAGEIGNSPGQINPAVWKHVAGCRFREDYSEKTIHELTGPDGGPIQGEITYRVVDPAKDASE